MLKIRWCNTTNFPNALRREWGGLVLEDKLYIINYNKRDETTKNGQIQELYIT